MRTIEDAHAGLPPLSSESDLIARFTRAIDSAGIRPKGLVLGVGDDAAIVRGATEDLVITSDAQVEGRHFRREWFPAPALGWRAAAVNLSDIAAMGASPRYALVSLLIPAQLDAAYVAGVEKGIVAHLARYGAAVIGGNLSATDGPLVVDITAIGACARNQAWRRGARAGDAVIVVGTPGNAAVGLSMLRENATARGALVKAYMKPVPRLDVAALLAGGTAVRGAIDTSDGLSTDVIHMCEAAGLGCDIDTTALPVSRALRSWCIMRGQDPVQWILCGGDDYGLILAVAKTRARALCAQIAGKARVPATVVGHFTRIPGAYRLIGRDGAARDFRATGWDHFSAGRTPST